MSIDFFNTGMEQIITYDQFGIIDDRSGPANIDLAHKRLWIAIINNPDKKPLIFTPIDKCLKLLKDNGSPDQKCDAMLYYKHDLLIMIELKESIRRISWANDGIWQIIETIKHLKINNPDLEKKFKIKIAYVANRLQPQVNVVNGSRAKQFQRKTGFLLKMDGINNMINIAKLLAILKLFSPDHLA